MLKINIYISVLTTGALLLGLSGCQKTESTAERVPEQKGPAEKVGENLDKAAAEAAKHLNTMAEHAGKGLEKAGESLQREAKDAQERAARAKDADAKKAEIEEPKK